MRTWLSQALRSSEWLSAGHSLAKCWRSAGDLLAKSLVFFGRGCHVCVI